ncbi:MAG: hypothetical protein QNJ77_09175 [Acidimicrobiia bacterium]|nr:hypothetical protein [Acidimicrobiia bacterium]
MIDSLVAYLDPGTGATLMQLALAGTAGVAAAAKMRMNRLKKRSTKDAPADEERADVEETADQLTQSE